MSHCGAERLHSSPAGERRCGSPLSLDTAQIAECGGVAPLSSTAKAIVAPSGEKVGVAQARPTAATSAGSEPSPFIVQSVLGARKSSGAAPGAARQNATRSAAGLNASAVSASGESVRLVALPPV